MVNTGQFWMPGYGYVDYVPFGYQAPITVAVTDTSRYRKSIQAPANRLPMPMAIRSTYSW